MKHTDVFRCPICRQLNTTLYKMYVTDSGTIRSVPFHICQNSHCCLFVKIDLYKKIKVKYPDEEFIWNYE